MSASVQRKLQQAHQRLTAGDVAGAISICEDILALAPRNPEALWLLGTTHVMSGRPQEAVPLLEQVVAVVPNHGSALDSLGLAHLMLGHYAAAERPLRAAVALAGVPPSVRMRLGIALMHLGQHRDAIAQLQHVLSQEPANADARVNLGLVYGRAGDGAAAAREFEKLLAQVPDHPHALYNLGVLSMEHGDFERAESWFRRTLEVQPAYVDALINLGVTLQRRERLDEATTYLRRALAHDPPQAAAANALAQVLALQGSHREAREHYQRALQLDPRHLAAAEGLAAEDLALGRFPEAASRLREVVRAEPDNAPAWSSLASACFQCGALEEAEAAANRARKLDATQIGAYATLAQIHYVRSELDRAVRVLQDGVAATGPNHLLGMLVHLLHRICDWPQWQAAWARLAAELDRSADLGSPYWLLFEDTTPEQQLDYTCRWAANRFGHAAGVAGPAAHPQSEKLRIGYLSADFQEHPVARLIVEVLELHDRERFEIFAYSHGPDDGSALRARLRAAVDHFVDIAQEPDDRAVELIRSHALDLLVDLRGYTMGDRLQIMAGRPCPVQLTWLGYPGGTGAQFIDYLIADDFLIPEGAEKAYAERVLRMPDCYQPNDRQRPVGASRSRLEYGLPESGCVFCSFNQTVKITPAVFGRWMSLLRRVPGSVLWLLEDNQWATANLIAAARDENVSPERIIIAPRLPVAEHLARYRAADIALDTFPYGSHTTGSDALWSGCPLVALCGSTFAARVSGSLLTSCGLPDLVTDSLEKYEETAYTLATDAAFMQDVRSRLARARDSAPLFDSRRFTRSLEALYLQVLARAPLASS